MENKEVKKVGKKPRANKYEEKVRFDGTLEEMIQIAVKPLQKNKNASKR